MRKLTMLALSIACLSAEAQGINKPGGSLGIGIHGAGIFLSGVYTGVSRVGFFGGYAGVDRNKSDLPPEADFYWVHYTQKEWLSKNEFHGGLAFRATPAFTFGIGFGSKRVENYSYGPSTATGIVFRRGAASESESGIVGMIDFGNPRGLGGHIVAGSTGAGATVTWRF